MGDRYRDRDDRYYPQPSRVGSRGGGGGNGGGGERWDRDRLDSYTRRPPPSGLVERDVYEEHDYYARPQRREPSPKRYEGRERVVFKERDEYEVPYRPRFRYDEEPVTNAGAMVRRPREEERDIEIDIRRREYDRSPPKQFERPKFVRRQSSLDTFDRKPMPRYGEVARVREESVMIPAGRRRSPPRYREPPRYEDYEDIRISEQDRYGREEFVGYREREVERVRRNDQAEYEIEEREEIVEERREPKRGKTKMPLRLVNTEVLIRLEYPFEQEGETIIILKALHKDHIDEIIRLSREANARPQESRTTYIIEGAPPPAPVFQEPERVIETRTTEIIKEVEPGAQPSPRVPRSVQEWDVLSKSITSSRSPSPVRTVKSRRSRARSSSAVTRREIIIDDARDESATIRGGVGALIAPRDRRKSSRDIQSEIRALEAEKAALTLERRGGRNRNNEMIVLTEKDDEIVEVRRDKRGMMLVR